MRSNRSQSELFGLADVRAESIGPGVWLEKGMGLLDEAGQILEVNDALGDWLERQCASLKGTSFWKLLFARHPSWREPVEEMLASGETFLEVTLRTGGGERESSHWYRLELVKAPQSQSVRLNSVLAPVGELPDESYDEYFDDANARREIFARMLRAEAQLNNVMGRWPGVILSQRPDASFRFVSPSVETLTGMTAEEMERGGAVFWKLVHELDVEEVQKRMGLAAKSSQGVASTYRIRHWRTGRILYVLEHRQAVLTGTGLLLGYECVWLDVTRQTIAEKRLSSAAWKDTLATLTMGLAHDFTNVMAGIHSLSESFLAQLGESDPLREGMVLIKQSSMQASQLVHRIVNLHRERSGESVYYDLNEVVNEVVDLVRKIVPRRISLETEVASESLPLFVDVIEFRQVIINMVLNAVDAMPETGRLVLRTEKYETFPELKNAKGVVPRMPAACLAIQDSGCGIRERHLENIFDPFFTTKAMNKGSGLGLYNARLFLEKHHGAISVRSEEGRGSEFSLWLPIADFTEAAQNLPGLEPAATRRLSLLLAGPQSAPVTDLAEMLRSHGYHVVVAITEENVVDCMLSGDFEFDGMLLVIDGHDSPWLGVIGDVRRAAPKLKLILQLWGCEPDCLKAEVAAKSDWIVPPDLARQSLLERLRVLLDGEG